MHDDALAGGEQGEVGEPVHVSAQRCQVRLITRGKTTVTSGGGGEGKGQVIQAHGGAAHRDLVQHLRLAWGQQAQQFGEQNVGAPQQHRLVQHPFQRLVAGQVDSLLTGQVAQFGLDVAEAGPGRRAAARR